MSTSFFRVRFPLALVIASCGPVLAQPAGRSPLVDRPNGMRSAEPTHHVFIGARVHPEPGVVWARGFIEIRDGRIVSASDLAGGDVRIPDGATVHELDGEVIYAAFVDPFVQVESPRPGDDGAGRHWNAMVMPRRTALDEGGISAANAKQWREMGFGAALLVPEGGIFAGSGAMVSLAERPGDASADRPGVYRDGVFQVLDIETRGFEGRSYPTSTPGAVALMRQTLLDAVWQGAYAPTREGTNPANDLTPLEDPATPLLFLVDHELEHFLASDIADEFGRELVVLGNGMEFKWLEGIAALERSMILPLRFPAKPDVSSVGRAESVELETMMSWEQAPTNPRRLAERMRGGGATLALTASRLPRGKKFHDELRLAIRHGLGEADALAMLTTGPARIAGVEDQLGTIAPGKRANLLIASGGVFEKQTTLYDLWIDGRRHELKARPGPDYDGTWRMFVGPEDAPLFEMTLEISNSRTKAKIVGTETWNPDGGEGAPPHSSEARKIAIEGDRISFLLDDDDDEKVTYIISGVRVGSDRMLGTGVASDDSKFEWAARRIGAGGAPGEAEADDGEVEPDPDEGGEDAGGEAEAGEDRARGSGRSGGKVEARFEPAPALPGYPFGPYAVPYPHTPETLVFTDATIWTSSERGVIERGWLLMTQGRVARVEPGPTPEFLLDGSNPEVVVVDAQGKHITPGLIDAHSHTGLFRFGVNEAGQAVTAEVRIGDSLDPSHINWYRQLAMGVTTVNSLHGSANPIGGQNQIHKVRWGARTPAAMRLEGARPGIKFALGENVKQSNWNLRNNERTRYPQTRMGVETIIRDRFGAARLYAMQQAHWHLEDYAEDIERRTGRRPSEITPPRNTGRAAVDYGMELLRLEHAGEKVDFSVESRRIDLELEALAEILAGERLVHCHSYRQDEILMLCRVAEDFGFTIGSFQHGLEVYKVAEAVKENAIGASLFSDWWMYKMEVMDAIPFAGPLQTEAGVNTSYNSDSDELARRMNLEAAKALKYARPASGLTPADAFNFVTINPAKQLGIDGRTGSLEEGKDADLVIWSDNPLSTRAIAEVVYIEGVEVYSLEQDRVHRSRIASERQRLIQKILADPSSPARDPAPGERGGDRPVVDSPPDRMGVLASWIRAGFHPDDMRPGDCGCGIINHAIYYEQMER
jgi:N-acetylglucosamine-6-phosphate deacetylase